MSNYTSTRFDVLGTNRAVATPAPLKSLVGARPGILVVPEGIVEECVQLFGFSVRVARLLPECTITWRLHPQMRFARLRRLAPELFADLPPNVVLSTADLSHDMAGSHIALYRASSAIVSCVNHGLWPAYLAVGDADDLDPLYDLGTVVPRCTRPEDLVTLVQNGASAEDGQAVQAFVSRYYDPLDPDRVMAQLRHAEGGRP